MYIYLYIYKDCFKGSKTNLEGRDIAEYFSFSNSLLVLIKLENLIQISGLISLQVEPIRRQGVCPKLKILMRLRTF